MSRRYTAKALEAFGSVLAGDDLLALAKFVPRKGSVDEWLDGLPAAYLRHVSASGCLSNDKLLGLARDAARLLKRGEEASR